MESLNLYNCWKVTDNPLFLYTPYPWNHCESPLSILARNRVDIWPTQITLNYTCAVNLVPCFIKRNRGLHRPTVKQKLKRRGTTFTGYSCPGLDLVLLFPWKRWRSTGSAGSQRVLNVVYSAQPQWWQFLPKGYQLHPIPVSSSSSIVDQQLSGMYTPIFQPRRCEGGRNLGQTLSEKVSFIDTSEFCGFPKPRMNRQPKLDLAIFVSMSAWRKPSFVTINFHLKFNAIWNSMQSILVPLNQNLLFELAPPAPKILDKQSCATGQWRQL